MDLVLWLTVPYIKDDTTFARTQTVSKYIHERCKEQNRQLIVRFNTKRNYQQRQRVKRRSGNLKFDSKENNIYFASDEKQLKEIVKRAIELAKFKTEKGSVTDYTGISSNGVYYLYYFGEGRKIHQYPLGCARKRNAEFEKYLNFAKISFYYSEPRFIRWHDC